ncbi:MAG: zonular occludens toxin domain-containing protein [Rhodoferax sp.]|uniref:zonular occludens toxin domain-containing protein n=1 Tax=Rhodoferax sp. TaxID=50421 RepID=UPI00261F9654|nr:zonular occludens toxin domain-containing protein [Rhodoferax sp.]MDD5333649.1 zonular occludens toxin domain-containing protein [Rhodoferax sp.]MDD5333659.1 zonular occludens toxin domain-containing protein [Rhodoferax sp.]
MIYLRTGANGSGKTLLTLRDVREKSIKESRPVYHNGRFQLTADFDWKKIDIKDWQSVPDGAIFLVDECHNDFPIRTSREAVPEYVRMLAEHRVRGFDFFMITQHPLNMDAFVRRLIGAPGWHQHLKRASGGPLVSVLEWPSVNEVCQKAGSGASGSVSMVPFPTEVYNWYKSTSLDTAKIRIPFQLKVFVGALLLVPVLIYFAYTSFVANKAGSAKRPIAPGSAATSVVTSARPGVDAPLPGQKQSPAEYLATYKPRIEGLAYTAPRYDELTKPTSAPFPAGCVQMGERCSCYTEQGTKIPTTDMLCRQIAKDGYFKDWGGTGSGGARQVVPNGPTASAIPTFPATAAPGLPHS